MSQPRRGLSWAEHAAKETLARSFLFGKRPFLAPGNVYEHCDGYRQIGLALERKDLLPLAVFKHLDVVFRQVVYVTILFVGDIEWNSNKLGAEFDYLIVLIAFLLGGLLALIRLFLSGFRAGGCCVWAKPMGTDRRTRADTNAITNLILDDFISLHLPWPRNSRGGE